MSAKIWYLHIESDEWHGRTTVHTTELSAKLFLREVQIKELEAHHARADLEEMGDDELQELWEQETEGMGCYEETDLHALTTPVQAQVAVKTE